MEYKSNADNIIIDFAVSLGLDKWDWFALIISIVSIAIAISSMVFAIRTYHSQKQTEKNTQPIMNVEVLELLLGQKLLALRDSYMFLLALHYILDVTEYKTCPSKHYWKYMTIETEDIDESLFYDNVDKYNAIHSLKEAHKVFANDVESLRRILESTETDKESVKYEVKHLYYEIGNMLSSYKTVLEVCFNYDMIDVPNFFKSNFLYNNDATYLSPLQKRTMMYNKNNYEMFTHPFLKMYINCIVSVSYQAISNIPHLPNIQDKYFEDIIITLVNSILQNAVYKGANIYVWLLFAKEHNVDINSNNPKSHFEQVFLSLEDEEDSFKEDSRWLFYVKSRKQPLS